MKSILVALFLLLPAVAMAEPWCLVVDENETCAFDDAQTCYKAVAKFGGSCRPNATEIGARGDSRWCVVTSTYRKCIYRFKTQCLRVARENDGGCVENVEQALYLSTTRDEFGIASCRGDITCELEAGLGDLEDPGGFGVAGSEDLLIEPEPLQ